MRGGRIALTQRLGNPQPEPTADYQHYFACGLSLSAAALGLRAFGLQRCKWIPIAARRQSIGAPKPHGPARQGILDITQRASQVGLGDFVFELQHVIDILGANAGQVRQIRFVVVVRQAVVE